jgi:hypothetical protein
MSRLIIILLAIFLVSCSHIPIPKRGDYNRLRKLTYVERKIDCKMKCALFSIILNAAGVDNVIAWGKVVGTKGYHAWVETDRLVIDPTWNRIFAKKEAKRNRVTMGYIKVTVSKTGLKYHYYSVRGEV